jgi:hypothetical protein
MLLAGKPKAEIVSALKAAYDKQLLPALEAGAVAFMMSNSAYLFDAGDHNGPHVMFFTPLKDGKDWGAPSASSVYRQPIQSITPFRLNDFQYAKSNINSRIQVRTSCLGYSDSGG